MEHLKTLNQAFSEIDEDALADIIGGKSNNWWDGVVNILGVI